MSLFALDERSFPQFASLLQVSQKFASRHGCRFQPIRSEVGAREEYDGEAAHLVADPVFRDYMARLKPADGTVGAVLLMEELHHAQRILVAESARKIMVSTCKELDLFPPSPSPSGVAHTDCRYEEEGTVLEVAMRLYNDQAARLAEESEHGVSSMYFKVRTASFLLDVAEVAGVPLPPVPALCHESVEKFRSRAQEWKDKEDAVPTGSWVGSGTQWFSHKLRVAWEAAERVADFLMEERDPFIDTDDSQWYYVEGLERPT